MGFFFVNLFQESQFVSANLQNVIFRIFRGIHLFLLLMKKFHDNSLKHTVDMKVNRKEKFIIIMLGGIAKFNT